MTEEKRIVDIMKMGVVCKTHRPVMSLQKYKYSFKGQDAVNFLVSSGTVGTEEEAVRVGDRLLELELIARLTGKGVFLSDSSLYRFVKKLTKDEALRYATEMSKKILEKDRKYRMSTYKNCFTGSEFVDTFVASHQVDRNEATQTGNAILALRAIVQIRGDKDFEDETTSFYRFKLKREETRTGTGKVPFRSVFDLGDKLGEGAFSVVKEATHRQSQKSYAIKIVTKAKLSVEDEIALKDEIHVLKEMKHENIIQLYGVFDEVESIYLVTERMMGGELFDRIVQKAYYNEKDARDVCNILLDALSYCHSKKVAHRDLKPENLLLVSKEDDHNLKLADFGFAKKCVRPNSLTTQCGTPGYVAPEILRGVAYDTQADIWSLGVIVYILLGGYPPFIEKNQKQLFNRIKRGDYEFHPQYWNSVSSGAKTLITRMLTTDPALRITANDALKDAWIQGDAKTLAGMDLGKNLVEFKKFNAKRKFKGAVHAVMVMNKMESLGLDLLDREDEVSDVASRLRNL